MMPDSTNDGRMGGDDDVQTAEEFYATKKAQKHQVTQQAKRGAAEVYKSSKVYSTNDQKNGGEKDADPDSEDYVKMTNEEKLEFVTEDSG